MTLSSPQQTPHLILHLILLLSYPVPFLIQPLAEPPGLEEHHNIYKTSIATSPHLLHLLNHCPSPRLQTPVISTHWQTFLLIKHVPYHLLLFIALSPFILTPSHTTKLWSILAGAKPWVKNCLPWNKTTPRSSLTYLLANQPLTTNTFIRLNFMLMVLLRDWKPDLLPRVLHRRHVLIIHRLFLLSQSLLLSGSYSLL
jgi:hypothetical protein